MDSSCFLLAWAGGDHDIRSIESAIDRYRQWFLELIEQSEKTHQRLLTILVVLPGLDRADADPLDALQERLKDAFRRRRADGGPVPPPVHAEWPVERGVQAAEGADPAAGDSPDGRLGPAVPARLCSHLSAYLDRFAPDIPGHVRRLLGPKITAAGRPRAGRRLAGRGSVMRRYRTWLADSARWDGFEFREGEIVIRSVEVRDDLDADDLRAADLRRRQVCLAR